MEKLVLALGYAALALTSAYAAAVVISFYG
jgi:hypothetical protein